jgi:hypothetical protein
VRKARHNGLNGGVLSERRTPHPVGCERIFLSRKETLTLEQKTRGKKSKQKHNPKIYPTGWGVQNKKETQSESVQKLYNCG